MIIPGCTICHNERGDCVSPPGIRPIRYKGKKKNYLIKEKPGPEINPHPTSAYVCKESGQIRKIHLSASGARFQIPQDASACKISISWPFLVRAPRSAADSINKVVAGLYTRSYTRCWSVRYSRGIGGISAMFGKVPSGVVLMIKWCSSR